MTTAKRDLRLTTGGRTVVGDRPTALTVARVLAIGFGIGLAVNAALVLGLPYFVTVDGAAHLGGAAAFADAVLGRTQFVAQLASIQILPATNLIPEVPLGFLSELVGPQWAEKLLIAGFAVGFPLAVLYAVRGVGPRRWWLASVALPLTFGFVLNFGLYNYCYGLIGLVLVAGYVARHRAAWTPRSVATLTALVTLTYMAHVLPFTQACLLLGVVTLWDWFTDRERSVRSLVHRSAPVAIGVLPGLLLMITLIQGSPPGSAATSLPAAASLIGTLALAWGTVTFDLREAIFTTLVAVALFALAVAAILPRIRRRDLRPADAFFVFGLLVVIEVAIVPGGTMLGSGGSYVPQRLQVIPVVGLVMWLADRPWSSRVSLALVAACLVAALGITALRLPAYSTLSATVESYLGVAPCIAPESTIVQANLARIVPGSLDRTDELSDEVGRLSAATHGWPLANVEFEVGFFPVRNRDDANPYTYLIPDASRTVPMWEPLQRIPPSIDLLGEGRPAARAVDYVVVFGRSIASAETLANPDWISLERQLAAAYQRVTTSSDGLVQVYERTGSDAAARGAAQRSIAPAGACS